MRKQKLVECPWKRKEVERLEEEGKLPKRWKTGAAILQEEHRLAEQISQAEQEVKKFEKHLEEMEKWYKMMERLEYC
ncbi:hypothetical protein L873DRAFT_402780 [Choiromyces venosus 120613-1]|uniref:Uncharacterized protein n=1 Tax=Choiromyces venosus 120613-1 TaxID=1336337 RepID=A0A3N4J0K4_9PEZI|nr:hypothetical protein L873DRAFT_402780 [Choiromyces venosus 120613-1]